MNATLSLNPNRKASPMTISTLDAPRAPLADGLLGRIGTRIASGVRAIQHARMLQAMSELTDEQLTTLGLTRADIPRHAHACIYGPQA